jgi:hypothetical protein
MEDLKPSRDELTGRWTIEGLEPSEEVLVKICEMLRLGVNFKFARYGDGEFNCMFGKRGKNCDGHEYFPGMGERLRLALSRANYMVGIQPLALSIYPELIKNFLPSPVHIVNADVLHNASIDGILHHFLDSFNGRYIVLVGPAHLQYFFNGVHIVIPSVNCWTEYENVRQQIAFHTEGVHNAVVLLAASMMSEVLIDDFADEPLTFIDVGSVLDPYCGIKSRRYHHKLKL